MKSHTIGPWKSNPNDAAIWPTSGRRAPIATVFTAEDPASEISLESSSFSEEENANARLIAAAPDLLAAAKLLLRYDATVPDRPSGQRADGQLLIDAIRLARAAIAKAEKVLSETD